MGSCMGRCLPNSNPSHPYQSKHFLSTSQGNVDFQYLIEENINKNAANNRCFLYRFFSKHKQKRKFKKPVLELVEDLLAPNAEQSYSRLQRDPSTSSYGKDIPLQCLDARALLARTATSTPGSSLDLEWEHETLPISVLHDPSFSSWAVVPEEEVAPVSNSSTVPAGGPSDSDWSRVSSADSLEWDPVQTPLRASPAPSDIDTDTQQLLSEIERLTQQALKETGRELENS